MIKEFKNVGNPINRVDARDKVTGKTKYYGDLIPRGCLFAKIKHSTIAHGLVKSIDTSKAEKVPGVARVLTCFDVPKHPFPTAGHPYSLEIGHRDIADRNILNQHVRYYGDDVAVVVAETEIAANQAVDLIEVEYEEKDFVLDVQEAMKEGAPQLHEEFKDNVLGNSHIEEGDYEAAIKEPGLTKVEGWYEVPTVQHCHIENFGCFASVENGRIFITSSTQIPHIVRRSVAMALGLPWGQVRVNKPYIGGGFGNKQDVLYEALCAYCSMNVGGKPVRVDCSREETFRNNRVRHAERFHIVTWLKEDGSIHARKTEIFANNGAYASHGHAICAKGLGSINQIYPCDNFVGDGYTVYTNRPVAGAMRGYGMPQATFANEANIDDCARALGRDPLEYRMQIIMPDQYTDEFTKNQNWDDSFRQCLEAGKKHIKYDEKVKEYKNQTGNIRKGVGVAPFWYCTGVYPISVESSSCRMQLNLDGSVTMQCGETEIGQGADTAYMQMTADAVGLKSAEDVHVVSCQNTDVTPTGFGAYASRQTYMAGFAIEQTAAIFKKNILNYASQILKEGCWDEFNIKLKDISPDEMDIIDGNIVDENKIKLGTLEGLAIIGQYHKTNSLQMTAESTATIKSNAYSFGCTFVDLEVDINACKVKINNMINVHDCGRLINPALAEGQVHGGMSMGLGQGISEQMLFDDKTGKVLNGNLLDYKILTTMDHPNLVAEFIQNPEPTSPFGTKALGEPPACSPAAAIRSGVLNATGVAVNELPLNPHVLFKAFSKSGLIKED